MARSVDLRLKARGFDSRSFHFQVTNSRPVVHTHVPLFAKQYKLVPTKGRRSAAGKVTAGLA